MGDDDKIVVASDGALVPAGDIEAYESADIVSNVVEWKRRPKTDPAGVNADAVDLIEGALERLKSGKSVAVAVVEVLSDGGVGTHYSKSMHHHHLASGAARLATRLALD